MKSNNNKNYKAVDNSIFNEILYCLDDNNKQLYIFTKFFVEKENPNTAFDCFAASDANVISFSCLEVEKEDTKLVLEVDISTNKCTVIPSSNTYGFNGQTDIIEFLINHDIIEELREYASGYIDENHNEIPFPEIRNIADASAQELMAQHYFPDSSMSSIDDMMEVMAEEQDYENESRIGKFRDCYQEEYSNCIITTDGKELTFTFCNLNEDGESKSTKDVCIINPKNRKVTLIPSIGEKFSLKVSAKCIDQIQSLSSNWKGEIFGNSIPFSEISKSKSKETKIKKNTNDKATLRGVDNGKENEIEYQDFGSIVVTKKEIGSIDKPNIKKIISYIRETPSTNEITAINAGILFTQWFNNRAIADLLDACCDLCELNEQENKVFNMFVNNIPHYPTIHLTFYDGNLRIDCSRKKGKNSEYQSLGVSFYDSVFGLSANVGKASFTKWKIPAPFKRYIENLLSEFKNIEKNNI